MNAINRDEASKIFNLLDLSDDEYNCTLLSLSDQPSASFFLANIRGSQYILLLLATVFIVLILTLAILHWLHVWLYVTVEKRRSNLYFLVLLFPISASCCYIGMISPRASTIISSLGLLYFLTCLFILISLIRNLFGSRETFVNILQADKKLIDFQSPPFCCCCPCLPKAKTTSQNLRLLEWLVLQAPIVRAIVVTINVVAVAELREAANKYIKFSEAVTVASLLLAVFGVHTLARLAFDNLSQYGFMKIFRAVDIAMLFFVAQQSIIFDSILIKYDIISCGPLLSAHDNGRFICNFVLIVEMLLLSMLITFMVSPSRRKLKKSFITDHKSITSIYQFNGHLRYSEKCVL
ncbi:Organic solute transporter alpha-like protein [Dirofilaria immitis]